MLAQRIWFGLIALLASPVAAVPGAYTDPAAFTANVGIATSSFDFESLAAGTPIGGVALQPPGAQSTIQLPASLPDVLDPTGPALALEVVADTGDNPTSSGVQMLGVNDGQNFDAITAGSVLTFAFDPPVHAFGVTLITPEEPSGALFDLDVSLAVTGEPTAQLALGDGTLLGTFGGREYRAYFLGVVGASSFASATLDYGATTPDSGFFFNLDDLAIPIPEPHGGVMLLAGLGLLIHLNRIRNRPRRP